MPELNSNICILLSLFRLYRLLGEGKELNIQNKKAYHDYFVEDKLECGIALKGNEVKSIASGKASIKEAWVDIVNGELVLKQMHVTPWDTSNGFDVYRGLFFCHFIGFLWSYDMGWYGRTFKGSMDVRC